MSAHATYERMKCEACNGTGRIKRPPGAAKPYPLAIEREPPPTLY